MLRALHQIPPVTAERVATAKTLIRKLERKTKPSATLDRQVTEFLQCPGGGARRVKFTSDPGEALEWAQCVAYSRAFTFEVTMASGMQFEPHPSGALPKEHRAKCTLALIDRVCTSSVVNGEGCEARAITVAALELYISPGNPPAPLTLPIAMGGGAHGVAELDAPPSDPRPAGARVAARAG